MRKAQLIFVFLLVSLSHSIMAQLEVQVNVLPPYPVRLSDFSDFDSDILITISNLTLESYDVFLYGSLTNEDNGVRIETDLTAAAARPILIPPGNTVLTGEDLRDIFNPDILQITGSLTFEQIEGDQALPEGNYSLCIRAFDFFSRTVALSADPFVGQGCASYEVSKVQAPILDGPLCDEYIPSDQHIIPFTWFQTPSFGGTDNFTYTLRMVEVQAGPPLYQNPYNAFETSVDPYLVDITDIDVQSYLLMIPDEVTLEPGTTYAWQVIVSDPTGGVQFENEGRSEVCWFRYGSEVEEADFTFEPVFPGDGDVLPYNFMPFIVRFEPFSDQYIEYRGSMQLKEYTGGGYANVDSKDGDSNWRPDGPLATQRRVVFPEMTQDQSQHLPVYKRNGETGAVTFDRGKRYAWEFEGSMELSNGEIIRDDIPLQEFQTGMAPVDLQQPTNGATVEPGTITLQWEPVAPSSLFPPYDIVRAEGRRSVDFFTGVVDEHWVLEVATDTDFTDIYFTRNERIRDLDLLTSTEAEITNALYQQLQRDTAFTDEGTYHWRVKWLTEPGNLASEPYNISPVWNFTIGTPSTPADTTTTEGPCLSGCDAPAITDRTASGTLSTGTTLKIGLFDMEVTTISSSAGGQYTGEGEIEIPFLKFTVLVEFRNIQFNAENKIFSGTVRAREDRAFPFSRTSSDGAEALGMDEANAIDLGDYLNTGERLVSLFTGNRAIGLPIGIDKEIEGRQITVAILEMEFTPERADLNAVANIDLDLFGDTQFFSAGIGDFCFSPTGFGKEGIAYLPTDHTFELRNGASFAIKGLTSATSLSDSTTYSYFNWDCNGFRCLNLIGEYKFSRDVIVPDSEDGTPGDGQVTARMSFKTCRGTNLMASFTMDPFQIPSEAMEGYAFVVEEAWVDWSNFDNPPEFQSNLPTNYVHSALRSSDTRLRNTWHGFWLKTLHIRVPEYLGNVERERFGAGIRNMIIDDTGFTCSFNLENLVTWEEEGNVEGFAFSIDRLYVDIVQNAFAEAGMEGKLGLPIQDEREYLVYTAAVARDTATSSSGFRFVIRPEEELSIPIFIATADIAPTSTFELRLGGSGNFVGVDLNGSLSISSDNQPGEESGGNGALNLQMPGVTVEHLRLNSRDGFDDRDFRYSLASPQKSMSGFPISLDDLSLGLDGMNPSLTIQPRLTLAGESSGFSAAARITINSSIEEASSGKKKFRLTGVDLDAIHLDVTTSAISLTGYLEFYNEASAKGVRGALAAQLPMGIAASLKADFGAYRASETARFNTAQYYSYWYVEGMVTFGSTGLSLFPSLNLYGLGGGVYHHMTQVGVPQVNQVMSSGGSAESTEPVTTGISYVPSFDTNFGLKFMALFGDPNQGKAYNFDVTLQAQFSASAGLTHMGFTGQIRAVTEGINSIESSPIMGFVDINYYNPPGGDKVLEGSFGMSVDFYVLQGTGTMTSVPAGYTGPTDKYFVMAEFYVGPDQWYYHMGNPENRAGLSLTIGSMDLLTIQSYLMIGHGIPSTLPAPSEAFQRIFLGANPEQFNARNSDRLSELASGTQERSTASMEGARGFAMGANFEMSLSANPIPFYFSLEMVMGFDVNVTQDFERRCLETGVVPGRNGWYATGQFYAALEGSFGIEVKLFRRRRFPIFEMGAGMLLQGGLPDPVYAQGKARIRFSVLNGLFKGQYHFEATLGDVCTVNTGGAMANVEVLQDLEPAGGNDISVFTNLTAAFALPVNEVLEIPVEDDWEGTEPPLRVRPFIQSWELKEGNRTLVPTDPVNFMEDNTIAELAPSIVLKGNTSYTQKIVLKAHEIFRDGSEVLLDWEESQEETFVTGSAPDTLVDENILFSYPFKNQHFFMKGETQGDQGYVQLKRADPNIFDTYGRQEFREHDYVVRFIELGSDVTTEVPLTLIGDRSTIAFDVSELQNDTYYAVQLLKIAIQDEPEEAIGADQFGLGSEIMVSSAVSSAIRTQNLRLMQTALGNIDSDILKKRTLPGPTVRNEFEHLIYHYYFKTDADVRFEDKVRGISLDKSYGRFGDLEGFTLTFPSGISFDWLDGRGYRNSANRRVVEPLVDVFIERTGGEFATSEYPMNFYHTERIVPNIEGPLTSLRGTVNRHLLPGPPYLYQMDYGRFVRFTSDSPFLNPLTERELNTANNPPTREDRIRQSVTSSSSVGGFGGLGGSSSAFTSYVSTIEIASYAVTHTLSVPGISNFRRFKSMLAGYLTSRFPSVIVGSSLQENPNSYVNQYRARYGDARRPNGQTLTSYFLAFHPTQYGMFLRVMFTPNNRMLYPSTSGSNQHSFITQYRYPLPGRVVRMANGTSRRFTFSHIQE